MSHIKWIISSFINYVKETEDNNNEHHSDGHTHDENDAPHTHFDDAFSHPHDEHGNHIEEFPPLILGQSMIKETEEFYQPEYASNVG